MEFKYLLSAELNSVGGISGCGSNAGIGTNGPGRPTAGCPRNGAYGACGNIGKKLGTYGAYGKADPYTPSPVDVVNVPDGLLVCVYVPPPPLLLLLAPLLAELPVAGYAATENTWTHELMKTIPRPARLNQQFVLI